MAEFKNKRVILKFGGEKCKPCKRVEPTVRELEKKYPKVLVVSLDVDKNSKIADQYDIEKIPSFVALYAGKQKGDTYTGTDVDKIEDLFKDLSKKHAK